MTSLCTSRHVLSSRGYPSGCPSRHKPLSLHRVVAYNRGVTCPISPLIPNQPIHSRGKALRCRAENINNGNGDKAPVKLAPAPESDMLYVVRITIISISGAAMVKYGSLIINAPFHPDAGVALALVFGPPLIYSLVLFLDKQRLSKL